MTELFAGLDQLAQEIDTIFTLEVKPRQVQAIENLKVYTDVSGVLGSLSDPSSKALSSKESYSSQRSRDLGNKLKSGWSNDQDVEVREFSMADGTKHLVRKINVPSGGSFIEVMRIPQGLLPKSDVVYENFVIINSAGQAIDLLDLLVDDRYKHQIVSSGRKDVAQQKGLIESDSDKTTSLIPHAPADGDRNVFVLAAIEEMGHSFQFEVHNQSKIKQLAGSLVGSLNSLYMTFFRRDNKDLRERQFELSRVKEERNAKAFALNVIKRCRELGVDPLPGLDIRSMIKIEDNALKSYDQAYPNSSQKFSKT